MMPEPARSIVAAPRLPEALKLLARDSALTPLDLLSEALPDELFVSAAAWTNEYAAATATPRYLRDWRPTSAGELRVWLAIMVHMGLCRHPNTRAYWDTRLHKNHPATLMSCTRWHYIKRFIKFNEVRCSPRW